MRQSKIDKDGTMIHRGGQIRRDDAGMPEAGEREPEVLQPVTEGWLVILIPKRARVGERKGRFGRARAPRGKSRLARGR
jgi:hypothetical protein